MNNTADNTIETTELTSIDIEQLTALITSKFWWIPGSHAQIERCTVRELTECLLDCVLVYTLSQYRRVQINLFRARHLRNAASKYPDLDTFLRAEFSDQYAIYQAQSGETYYVIRRDI